MLCITLILEGEFDAGKIAQIINQAVSSFGKEGGCVWYD